MRRIGLGNELTWRGSASNDPHRQFAAFLLWQQIGFARVFAERSLDGSATLRTVLLGVGSERKDEETWRRVAQAELATYDDWLDEDNPDGAPRLMEMLGYDESVVERYKEVMHEYLETH
jgi:hypothetical protein